MIAYAIFREPSTAYSQYRMPMGVCQAQNDKNFTTLSQNALNIGICDAKYIFRKNVDSMSSGRYAAQNPIQ